MWKKLSMTLIAVVVLGGSASADDPNPKDKAPATQPSQPGPPPPPPPAPPAATDASAEVKAGTGVENRAIVGEASEFTAGTRVWIWSQVKGAADTTVKHVWKKDGAQVWAANLKIKSKKYTTNSRRNVRAGAWTVEVVGADGAVLGSVSFTVK